MNTTPTSLSPSTAVDAEVVTAARLLAVDAIERAKSGHPGAALSLAPVATLLFQHHLRHDPSTPSWAGRDRFVLSCGHASALLYVQLHLSGYAVTLDDLRSFRTEGSRTPGHPEFGHTDGVETTTGPLGQGLANAVGMAMGFAHERAVFDPDAAPGSSPFDRHVWVLASDGDMQEGLSYEAGALAGRLGLGNLTVIYDDNDIQIEGSSSLTTSEDAAARYRAQGWDVSHVPLRADGEVDVDLLDATLAAPLTGRPRLVILKSQIAFPAPHAVGTAASHGAPLGADEVGALRRVLGVDDEPFHVNPEVLARARAVVDRGVEARAEWERGFAEWQRRDADRAARHRTFLARELPADLDAQLPTYAAGSTVSTRDASGAAIQAIAAAVPGLWGGSADLAEPNRTEIKDGGSFLPASSGLGTPTGRNIHWGVREHAMASAMNGIALAGGWVPFAGTFLVFSDYQRPAIRLAALMQLPVTYIWSHDSVALGQDGPTHQPIEQLAALRAIPGLSVVRPADANETAAAWASALRRQAPVGLVLGRQGVPVLPLALDDVRAGVARGGYVVREVERPAVLLIATGSEVALALETAEQAAAEGIAVRVVSMPSREWFAEQSADYREQVLPSAVTARVVVEAATSFGWHDIAGSAGAVVGIDEFGLSAPADDALRARGMTVERVLDAVRRVSAPSA